MNLSGRVAAKLDRGVDASTFEACAVALLAKTYDHVVGIEGGSDGGRDADIIAPISGEPESRGRILVTTGDPLSNLKGSHKTWKKFWDAGEKFRIDQLVIVASRNLSDTKRRHIEEYCRDNSLPVPQIHARQWVVDALRREPDIRIKLTGISGRVEALSASPPEPTSKTAIIGREEDLQRLREAIGATSDVLLLGLPGVGKSRVLAELEGIVHFVDRLAGEYLADDLIATEPSYVVIDDAHLNLETLELLTRIRSRERLGFSIIAATWPGSESLVEELLSEAKHVELDRLARSELDEIIQSLGVEGVRARTHILEQADGRPGWALVLSKLIVGGDGDLIAAGQPLLDKVTNLTVAISGTAVLSEAMACVAALGTATLEDLEIIADYSRVPYADLMAWLEATAQGGLVERSDDRWSVLAPLRSLSVASTFFGVRKRRNWANFSKIFPYDERLTTTILKVAIDVHDPTARSLADTWFNEIKECSIEAIPLALIEMYGRLDERAADGAAEVARGVLRCSREPINLYNGYTYDPVGEAAEKVLRTAFLRTCSREACFGLLDLASYDNRPRYRHPDHPMRAIEDLAHYLDPDLGSFDGLRDKILQYALMWFDERPDGVRWKVLAEVAGYVFDPSLEGNWSDPGNHLSVTLSRGLMSPRAINELASLWFEMDGRIRGESGVEVSHQAVSQLCSIFEVWSSLAMGVKGSIGKVSKSHRDAAADCASRVLTTLGGLSERFPGVPIRINRQLIRLYNWGAVPNFLKCMQVTDLRLARLVGIREANDDVDAWIAERKAQQLSLAGELDRFSAAAGIAEYRRLTLEASVLGGDHESSQMASALAKVVSDKRGWLQAAIDARLRVLVGPMVAEARLSLCDVADLVESALLIEDLRPEVLQALLREKGEVDDLGEFVLSQLVESDVLLIGELWIQDQVTPMLRKLLTHRLAVVRGLAAVEFRVGGKGHGLDVPDDLRAAWRRALVEVDPDSLPSHSNWRLSEIVKHAIAFDPELCADWIITSVENFESGVGSSLRRSIRDLPREQKWRTLTSSGIDALKSGDLLGDLLWGDSTLALELLENGMVNERDLLSALSGSRDETIEAVLPAFIAAGGDLGRAVCTALGSGSFSGAESQSITEDLGFFADLRSRRPDLTEFCDLAIAQLKRGLDVALVEERQRRVRGW